LSDGIASETEFVNLGSDSFNGEAVSSSSILMALALGNFEVAGVCAVNCILISSRRIATSEATKLGVI
jgi:hypothetical protein